jgi:AcrR family transcriptional regulator
VPRRPGRALGRAEVVEAALQVVREGGPDALGVNAVARALGIQPPSLYNHVRDGDDLARAVAIEGWVRLEAACIGCVAPDTLRCVARMYRGFAHEEPALYALMHRVRVPPGQAGAALLALLAQALRERGIAEGEIIHATRALCALLHGFVSLELAGQFGLPEDVDTSFEQAVERAIAALG